MTGDGVRCQDINECEMFKPCFNGVQCINLSPGFRCGSCPPGYTGRAIQGIGLEAARSNRQVTNAAQHFGVNVQTYFFRCVEM